MNNDYRLKWPLGQAPKIVYRIPERMEALTIRRDMYGPPADVVRLTEVPAPRLQPEDAKRVLVAILATGPNFNTNFAALGLPVPVFGRGDIETIHIPGSDALGLVVDVGPAVKELKVGQAVILDSWTDMNAIRGYETHDGFNAQFAVVDERRAWAVPGELKSHEPERLAALLLTHGTAYRAVVERLAVAPGETILLMGGGKGTSFAGAQIAKSLGARVLLMGSNLGLAESLIKRGIADAFIDRKKIPDMVFGPIPTGLDFRRWEERTRPFREAVFNASGGKPVDKIFEHTGGDNFPLLVSVLSKGGRIAFFGATGRGMKGEYKETFFYAGRRFVFDARWVWMRQKQILFRNAGPETIFQEIGLHPGRKGLIWGADAYAQEFAKAALARKADLVIVASRTKERTGMEILKQLGVKESQFIDRDLHRLPEDMPDPLTDEGVPNHQYGEEYMAFARTLGSAIWNIFGPRVSPDFIVERPDQSTLHFSTFLVRDYSEQDDMPSGIVVMRGPENLSILGSHMYRATQAREVIRLLEQKRITMGRTDLEITGLDGIPSIQQKMLDGKMDKPKGVALVQADRAGRSIDSYEKAFLGEILKEADPQHRAYLDVHHTSEVGLIVLKRTEALNALNRDLVAQLAEAFGEVKKSGTLFGRKVKALVLASGLRAFAAGADVTEFQGQSAETVTAIALKNLKVIENIEDLPLPVISVIDGFALGGGNELAMGTHYRIVTGNARLGQPEIKLGIIPGYGGLQRLPRLVGPRLAAEMSLNGEPITGRRAVEVGLADEFSPAGVALARAFQVAREFIDGRRLFTPRVWDDISLRWKKELEDLLQDAEVREIMSMPSPQGDNARDLEVARRYAARYAIEAIHYGFQHGFHKGLENDARLFGLAAASTSGQEWIRRFIAKDPRQGSFFTLLHSRVNQEK